MILLMPGTPRHPAGRGGPVARLILAGVDLFHPGGGRRLLELLLRLRPRGRNGQLPGLVRRHTLLCDVRSTFSWMEELRTAAAAAASCLLQLLLGLSFVFQIFQSIIPNIKSLNSSIKLLKRI